MERWNVELNFAAYAVFLMIHDVDGQNPKNHLEWLETLKIGISINCFLEFVN